MTQAHSVNKLTKNNFIDYLITVGAIFSVNPFFGTVTNFYLLIYLVFLLIIGINRQIKLFDYRITLLILFIYMLIVLQGVRFGGFSYAAVYTPLIIFYVPYLIYNLMKEQFFVFFVKVMFSIVLFTTPLWFLQSLVPSIDNLFRQLIVEIFPYSYGSVPRSLLVFTPMWADYGFNFNFGLYRNSGLFHEPGAYGVFLIFAIVSQIFTTKGKINYIGLIFILALLSTFSTANYIALFVLLLGYFLSLEKNIFKKVIFVSILILFSIIAYNITDFLGEKVNDQFSSQITLAEMNSGIYAGQSGRFYAFFTAYKLFWQNPITGRGIIYATSEKATGEMHNEASYIYGPMGLMATYGIIFSLIYFTLIYKGIKNVFNYERHYFLVTGIFLSLLLAVSSQVFVLTFFIVYISIHGLHNFNKSKFNA